MKYCTIWATLVKKVYVSSLSGAPNSFSVVYLVSFLIAHSHTEQLADRISGLRARSKIIAAKS
jgi:hypothetical protein